MKVYFHFSKFLAPAFFAFAATASGSLLTTTTLHSFNTVNGGGDGSGFNSESALVSGADGDFYGATIEGGAFQDGAIFKITSAGELTILYSFSAQDSSAHNLDGAYPYAALTRGSDDNFYGTTEAGGPTGAGTVFKITLAGVLTTLHTFSGGNGSFPKAALVQASDGNFYGTTYGTYGQAVVSYGTIFKITPDGVLTTLHTFDATAGHSPESALVQGSDGNFYGETYYGGTKNKGVIFQMTPDGTVTTLYNFTGIDGSGPTSALTLGSDGNFYGVTSSGGTNGDGTIFQITSAGALTTLHDFDGSDGQEPAARLVQGSDGNFYGSTVYGGISSSDPTNLPSGTVFQITSAGAFTTEYFFTQTDANVANADGAYPGGLIQGTDGNFYGVTNRGGTAGDGTVFRLNLTATPPPTPTPTPTPTLTPTPTPNPGTPVITAAASVSVAHLDTGVAGVVTLNISNPQTTKTTIHYLLKGSAVNGKDYDLLSGKAKIKPGKLSASVQIIPKGSPGSSESKTVKLVIEPGSAFTVGMTTPIKIKIKN